MTEKDVATILTVAQDDRNRTAISQLLRSAGFRVHEAHNSEEGLRLLAKNPELVILQARVSGSSGVDLCRQIKTDPITASIPVVRITTARSEPSGEPADDADARLTEPVQARELFATINALLRRRMSGRNRADEALAGHETPLRLALEACELGTWDYDAASDRWTWSKHCNTLCGLPVERELRYPDYLSAIHPGDRAWVEWAHQSVLDPAGSGQCELEYRVVWPDGTVRWINSRGRVLFEEEGDCRRPVRFVGVLRDVTDNKKAETALRESESQLNLALDAACMAYWDWNLETQTFLYSHQFTSLCGLPWEALSGQSLRGIVRRIDRQDRTALLAALKAAMSLPQPLDIELRVVLPDDSQRWISAKGQCFFDALGHPVRMTGVASDVTERKRVEDELRRFKVLSDHANDAQLFVDGQDRMLYVNRVACEQLCSTEEELLAQGLIQIGLVRDEVQFQELLQRAGRERVPPIETTIKRPDGVRLPVEVSYTRVDFDGVAHLAATVRDLGERKRAEQQLRDNEQRLRRAQRAANAGTWDWNIISGKISWSEEMDKIFGRTPENRPRTYEDWLRLVHPDDRDRAHELIYAALNCDGELDLEYRVALQNGQERWINSRGQAYYDQAGRTVLMTGIAVDVSERKRIEQDRDRLLQRELQRIGLQQRLVEFSLAVNAARSQDEVLQVAADGARKVVGARQAIISLVLSGNWREARHATSLDEAYRQWSDHQNLPDGGGIDVKVYGASGSLRMDCNQLAQHTECRGFLPASGAPDPQSWLAIRLDGEDAALLGLIQLFDKREGAFSDEDEVVLQQIAQCVSVALRNTRLVEALREADRRKNEFLAMLAHELRNPLGPISNAVEVLRPMEEVEPALKEAGDVIDRQVNHMARLIDDLLDVSRIARGKILLRQELLDVVALVKATVEDYRSTFDSAGLSLSEEHPERPAWIIGDPTRLRQIVGNLLHNACKFTERGGRVKVSVACDPEYQIVEIKVVDTGIGLASEMLLRVFDTFSQADQSLERSRGGLGLGLALVKGFVELHGGHVHASSAGLGMGSEFSLRLPLVQESAPAAPAAPEVPRCKPTRILLIEDNHDAAQMLSSLLERAGHEVRLAYDGASGLEMARRFLPEVVVCDISLPGGMDGYQVAQRLRQIPEMATAGLLALTGHGREEDQRLAVEAGFALHLTKPVNFRALQRALAALSNP